MKLHKQKIHDKTSNLVQYRADLVDYLRNQLIGPLHGENEVIEEEPYRRYIMATLYPYYMSFSTAQKSEPLTSEGTTISLKNSETSTTESSNINDDAVANANNVFPASLGISFYLTEHRRSSWCPGSVASRWSSFLRGCAHAQPCR